MSQPAASSVEACVDAARVGEERHERVVAAVCGVVREALRQLSVDDSLPMHTPRLNATDGEDLSSSNGGCTLLTRVQCLQLLAETDEQSDAAIDSSNVIDAAKNSNDSALVRSDDKVVNQDDADDKQDDGSSASDDKADGNKQDDEDAHNNEQKNNEPLASTSSPSPSTMSRALRLQRPLCDELAQQLVCLWTRAAAVDANDALDEVHGKGDHADDGDQPESLAVRHGHVVGASTLPYALRVVEGFQQSIDLERLRLRMFEHVDASRSLVDTICQATHNNNIVDMNSTHVPPMRRLLAEQLGMRGIMTLLGVQCTFGSFECVPPSLSQLRRAFNAPHMKGDKVCEITVGARALSKHFHRASDGWWGEPKGPVASRNAFANELLERILSGCVWMNCHGLPSIVNILRAMSMIGFLEPQDAEGHDKGWKH